MAYIDHQLSTAGLKATAAAVPQQDLKTALIS